ncbi:phosphate metabolism protein 7 [Fusarium torreyae]|uniref:Phosphate metabolism protein 7 n=1 Tax=Fusarium torreyae TaxID=1237075 RepID=A0A9W8S5K6_9HYPO|nr:phosphate metabolism protein 7 [Fusarium torreyae]
MGNFISWLEKNLPDPNSGDARGAQPKSLSGMISTLVPVLIASAIYIVVFLILRKSNRRFYAPRTYLGSLPADERSPQLSSGLFGWFGTFWKLPDAYALQHQSLDSYLFIRFLRICCTICFVSLCLTWPVLFPVNATGGNGKKELEILSYSNIRIEDSKQRNRLYAHCFIAWLVYGFIIYTIMRECIFYISVRQAFLLTPKYANRISSRTVLFTSVPKEYLDETRIRTLFNNSVKNVWIAGDTKELDEIIEDRDKAAMKLEKGEVKLLKLVNKERIKSMKKSDPEAQKVASAPSDPESGSLAARWIPDKKRPSHRTGPLGLLGKKVDTIEWGREELRTLIPKADNAQADWLAGNYKKHSAVFVEFYTQSDAQAAYQTTTHHHALHMAPRYIGVKPDEVVWKSLNFPWWQIVIRRYVIFAIIAALIIFWAIPVAIVGVIAQVNTIKTLPGLTWIQDIPSVILGVVSGLLPSVALSILMSLVPVFMRICAKQAGCVSVSQAELFVQNSYFVFQVLQVFLVQTLANSFVVSIATIVKDPSQVFTMLSQSIPTASNFYIAYFIVQGLTIATSVLTQVVGCIIFNLLYKFLTSTPRSMYQKWTRLSALSWGSLLPVYTNIAVITPLMLFWSTIGMALFYLAYRYNVLFVTETTIDTHGLIYPRALKQLFVGVYLAEICMVGMFIISKAPGPAVLMAAFLVFTILFHISLAKALNPLLYSLPRSLEVEEERIQNSQQGSELEDGHAHNGEGASNGASNGAGKIAGKLVPGGAGSVQKKGNFFSKWLKPWIYADYETMRKLVPQGGNLSDQQYSEEVEGNAYFPPSVTSETPILWIPADPAGVSKQEVFNTSKVIPISDEGCTLNDKNHIEWDTEGARPPIWSEKVYY